MSVKSFELLHPSFDILKVQKLNNNVAMPKRSTDGAVGYDLCASHNCTVLAKGKGLVQNGLVISFPESLYARTALRSELAPQKSLLMLGQVWLIQIIVGKCECFSTMETIILRSKWKIGLLNLF